MIISTLNYIRVVSEIMTTNLITVTPNTRLDQALKIMISNSVSRLPVVEEEAPGLLYKEIICLFSLIMVCFYFPSCVQYHCK